MAGHGEVGLDAHAPRPVERRAEGPRERARRDAGGPEHRARRDPHAVTQGDSLRVDGGDGRPGPHLDAEPLELPPRRVGQGLRVPGKHARGGLEQEHPRALGVDVAEVVRERVPRDLGDRAGELDAGRAAADDDEREQRPLLLRIALALGRLERDQDPPPDLERVLDALEAGRDRRPLVVPEVRVRRAGREDEEVVRQRITVREPDGPRRQVDRRHVAEQHPALRCRRSTLRIGEAMSAGFRAAVATW